ncbi:MAG: phytanoyl-CoA dioxygenase family protein [Chloroflexota bacterium]|nr:phytanoyl-CoA dioxygenase family protein [Chloroflexota bacterium]
MTAISPQDAQFYADNGYFLYRQPVFSEEKFQQLYGIFEEHLAEKGSKLSDELDTPHFRDPRLLDFLLDDAVLDLVEPLIGGNIGLWSSHFISKDPFKGRATPWHEDSAYWKGRLSGFDRIVTVWLAIDRSNQENGCMRVIPGTHNNGFSQYEAVSTDTNTFATAIAAVDESQAVYFELEPNQCSMHDSRIIHGATANTSPHRRCGYTMRYFSTELQVFADKNSTHKVWLARGRDVAGNRFENA